MVRRRKVVRWDDVGDTVSIEASIQQATQALDLAGAFATRTKNSEDLTSISHGWMRMVETLAGLSAQAEARGAEPSDKQVGFVGYVPPLDETSKTERAQEEDV